MKHVLQTFFSFLVICCTVIIQPATAQDFHLSQYDAPPLNLNPAMTGMFNGYYRIHGHYRTQWSAIATKPFVTTALSGDIPYKNFGFGTQIMNYRAGAGIYNVFNFLLAGAYDFSLDSMGNHHIATGVELGFLQKSIDINKLYFENQYSPIGGGGFNPDLSNGELFMNTRDLSADINAGIIYYYANEASLMKPFIGFAAYHLTRPNETFLDQKNKLPLRYVIHGGVKLDLSEKIQLLPKVLSMQQATAKELMLGLAANYYLHESDSYLILSVTGRSKDAFIIETGLKKSRYICRISYDVNTSSLQSWTKRRGGLELSLTYTARKQKPNPIPNCPRL